MKPRVQHEVFYPESTSAMRRCPTKLIGIPLAWAQLQWIYSFRFHRTFTRTFLHIDSSDGEGFGCIKEKHTYIIIFFIIIIIIINVKSSSK